MRDQQNIKISNQIEIQATSFSNNPHHSAVLCCLNSLELFSHLILEFISISAKDQISIDP